MKEAALKLWTERGWEPMYPKTVTSSVYHSDGRTLETILNLGYGGVVNLRAGDGDGSVQQLSAQALGKQAVAFGGLRADRLPEELDEDDRVTTAEGVQSAAFGAGNWAHGYWNLVAGHNSDTYQKDAFAFGGSNQAGDASADANTYSFAFATGNNNKATGRSSFVSGTSNEATMENAAAFGRQNLAKGTNSFTTGQKCETLADCTNTLGFGLRAVYRDQTAVGKYNVSNDYALFTVGNGTSSSRRNAIEVADNGRIYCYLTSEGQNTNWHGDLLTRKEIKSLIESYLVSIKTAIRNLGGSI